MGKAYSCTFADCRKVFSKAYELKKHRAAHDDPNSVYYCSQCDFFTLQKKNLMIHFAIHTGEKTYRCPDMISFVSFSEPTSCEEPCEYRTNDPAALTKHRKKVHGYIPPPHRSRPLKAAPTSRKPRQKLGQHPRPSRRPAPDSCLKSSRARSISSGAEYTTTSTEPPEDPSPLLSQGDVDVSGQQTDANSFDVSGYESSISSSATLVTPEEEMDLNTIYDPSLHSKWMARYEMGYGMFDVTGMTHLPEPVHAVSPPTVADLAIQTGRGGCLCPEWMVEAGIEGWDQSILESYRELYVLGA